MKQQKHNEKKQQVFCASALELIISPWIALISCLCYEMHKKCEKCVNAATFRALNSKWRECLIVNRFFYQEKIIY